MDQEGPAAEVIRSLWKELPDLAGMVLGCDVTCKSPTLQIDFEPPARAYIARLDQEDGGASAWVVFDLPVAISAAGLLVMRQETTIKKRIDDGTFEGDDFDAMGEFVNQVVPTINDALKKGPGTAPHYVFKEGSIDAEAMPESTGVLVAFGEIGVGGLAKGLLRLVMAPEVLGVEIETDDGDTGLELSPEELAAIREATRDAVGGNRTLVVVPLERERPTWTETLDGVGLDFEFVTDVAALRRQLGKGDIGAVVIDADTCPAGGLPILAALRTGTNADIPALVVASSPTRSHLLSCIAAGARGYLTKPVEGHQLVESIGSISMR